MVRPRGGNLDETDVTILIFTYILAKVVWNITVQKQQTLIFIPTIAKVGFQSPDIKRHINSS